MKDYIELSKEQSNKIRNLFFEKTNSSFFSLKQCPFTNFVLKIENDKHKTLTFDYEVSGENVLSVNIGGLIKLYSRIEYKEKEREYALIISNVEKDVRTPNSIISQLLFFNERNNEQKRKELISIYFMPFFELNYYVREHLPTVFRKEIKKRELAIFYKGKSKDKNKRRAIQLCNVYTLNEDFEDFSGGAEKRHIEFSCPSWGVRGHYRHLKNGKVVFVRPFIKGKERKNPDKYNNYRGKEYKI